MPDPKTFKQHFENKHPSSPLPEELKDVWCNHGLVDDVLIATFHFFVYIFYSYTSHSFLKVEFLIHDFYKSYNLSSHNSHHALCLSNYFKLFQSKFRLYSESDSVFLESVIILYSKTCLSHVTRYVTIRLFYMRANLCTGYFTNSYLIIFVTSTLALFSLVTILSECSSSLDSVNVDYGYLFIISNIPKCSLYIHQLWILVAEMDTLFMNTYLHILLSDLFIFSLEKCKPIFKFKNALLSYSLNLTILWNKNVFEYYKHAVNSSELISILK